MIEIPQSPGPGSPDEEKTDPAHGSDFLRGYVNRVAPEWRVAHKPEGRGVFGRRIDATGESLDRLSMFLHAQDRRGSELTEPLIELRQSSMLLRSVMTEISSIRKELSRLPRVIRPREGDEPRIVTVADAYLKASGSIWEFETAKIFLDQVQQYDALELKEIWIFPAVLKFLLLEEIIAQADSLAKQAPAKGVDPLIRVCMKSLRELEHIDWPSLIEPLVIIHPILCQDPADAYRFMDFDSREAYRKRVAEIARHSDCSEREVAEAAVQLAGAAKRTGLLGDSRVHLRRSHVGFYLIDHGFAQLAVRVGFRPRLIDRIRLTIERNADDFYIGGIQVLTVILIGLILAPLVPTYSIFGALTWAFLLLLIPATQGAMDLINHTVTAIFKASARPKLDFSRGVPQEFSTLVVVPTLLLNEKQTRELFENLEVRYLANEDRNIHFGLLTDLPDSVVRPQQNDTDPLVSLAIQLTEELNSRYSSDGNGTFFLLHRHRIFNARQGVWMGWERKRGKLLDLNKLLTGQFDAFPVKSGNLNALMQARYVITLDSDTQLPRDTAQSMIGTMAHPLNRAIIDPESRIVTEGYGILQPRVGVSVQSASRSRLASIYSGETGFDIYTRAVSDVYQDLYAEGSFTGKGIYEIDVLHRVLDRRFPRNSLLSHDLIEGAYSRVGLVTDIEIIDDYPSHYSAYNRRKHRWVRGDWQIAQWLFSKVPDESGRYVRNPISTISRWKIFDNLRRSLVEILTFALLLAGWLGLPGGALYWTLVTLFLIFIPTLVQWGFSLGRALLAETPGGARESFNNFWQGAFIDLLNLASLPHQTLLTLDAIIRSLVRSFITGQRLLEWETAAEAESNAQRSPVDRYLAATPLVALVCGLLVFLRQPKSLVIALPILVLWACAGPITAWLNRPPRDAHAHLSERQISFMRLLALRSWRFFHQFGGESHNHLIPDNIEEEGLFEAARVSPTNFGLLLNARQAACTFGYLTAPEFVTATDRSLKTYEKMEKCRGHIYNWYETKTLKPIFPRTVSSVDSGNLAASFYTLRSGCQAMLAQPLLHRSLFRGIHDHWQLLLSRVDSPVEWTALTPPPKEAPAARWIEWTLSTVGAPQFAAIPSDKRADKSTGEAQWWLTETRQRLQAVVTLVEDYMPWLLPEFEALRVLPQMQGLSSSSGSVSIGEAAEFAAELDARASRASANLRSDSPEVVAVEKLRIALRPARTRLQTLSTSLSALAEQAMRFATDMDFEFLLDPARLLLSIGYDVETGRPHDACYDLLASEARIAAFIAIAKGEAPQQSWFRLGRTHTWAYGHPVLISWTGTMFEYLMPSLWMRSYPDTLTSRTLSAVVAIQQAFGRKRNIPWGISESGMAAKDDQNHYHYQAFGIPAIALKWDATAGPVISPYSTCLALAVDPAGSIRNLRHMEELGWLGAFGFYEAADFQESLKKPVLVKEWMAHHQGMSLLAITNLLHENVVQDWFHSNAHLQATQLLLHEKPMPMSALRATRRSLQRAS